ncbi:hypothetical protein AAE478_007275 [Parahypoxylon ruwenzoriense]
MVKMVNYVQAQLAAARRVIEELQAENKALVRRNESLQCEIKRRQASTRRKIPSEPRGNPITSSEDDQTCRKQPNYIQPTEASKNRAAETGIKRMANHNAQPRIAVFCGQSYAYGKAHLKQLSYTNGVLPRYMQDTQSSSAKKEWPITRRLDQWDINMTTYVSRPDYEEGESPENVDNENFDGENFDGEAITDTDQIWQMRSSQLSGLDRSKFTDNAVYIPSKIGLEILTAGFRIVQEAVYEAAQMFWPFLWKQFSDGPHLVTFGRVELNHRLACHTKDLSLCGSPSHIVVDALMDIVDLRNRICHPEQYCLQNPEGIDIYLQDAEKLSIIIGDEGRRMQLTSLRSRLVQTGRDVVNEIHQFYPLAMLPFTNFEPHWEPHIERIFKMAIYKQHRGDDGDPHILQVAYKWAMENGAVDMSFTI